jgi:hypothetical protein
MQLLQRSAGQLPAPLARLAQRQLTVTGSENDPYLVQPIGPVLGTAQRLPDPPLIEPEHHPSRWLPAGAVQVPPAKETANQPQSESGQTSFEPWLAHFYQSQAQGGRGQAQLLERGRDLLGEELTGPVQRALTRRSQAEAQTVLNAARQMAAKTPRAALIGTEGQLQPAALAAVRARLPQATAAKFTDRADQQDLAALTAAALQRPHQAPPADFRRVVAQAKDGSGETAPGRTIPRRLGLDPVAAQGHLAPLNRFVRLSQQAGLSVDQRQQLLSEVQQGQVSAALRQQLKVSLQRQQARGQAASLKVEDVVAGAQALPPTLTGPQRLRLEGVTVEAKAGPGKTTLPQQLKEPPEKPAAPPDRLPRPVSGRVAGTGPLTDRPHGPAKKAVKEGLTSRKVNDEAKHAVQSDSAAAADDPAARPAAAGRGRGEPADQPAADGDQPV